MFRRRWSGLPADPVFNSNFEDLGYFVNDCDEIRSQDDPNYYFKFFLSRNERWNERQRFAMHAAVGDLVSSRLRNEEGLEKLNVPLGASEAEPHCSIFLSPDLEKKSRVVVFVGQDIQKLGILAFRTCLGRGGVNKGSVVSLVQALKAQPSSSSDSSPPGLVIANTGERWWWPEGKRALTEKARHAIPLSSAVHRGRVYRAGENTIPGSETPAQHVKYIFEKVLLPKLLNKETETKVDIIAVGDGAETVEAYLNNDDVWAKVGKRLNSMVILGGYFNKEEMVCEGFKTFMRERARAYIIHGAPIGTLVAGPDGDLDPGQTRFTRFGCPSYSAGESCILDEMILTDSMDDMLKWMEEVTLLGEDYKNPVFMTMDDDDDGVEDTRDEEQVE